MTKKILPGILLLVLSVSGAFAEDKMTRDEYEANLTEYKDRQATADTKIAQLDGDIAKLKNQIGNPKSYEEYIENLNSVWEECIRILHPDGKICINIMPIFLSGDQTQFKRRVTKTAIACPLISSGLPTAAASATLG